MPRASSTVRSRASRCPRAFATARTRAGRRCDRSGGRAMTAAMTTASNDAFVLSTVRTPRGKGSKRGALAGVTPLALVRGLIDALVERGMPRDAVDDFVLGCASQVGEQGGNLARTAALVAG